MAFRILLADDHLIVRRGLKQTLAEHFPAAIFGEAGNAQEAIDSISKEKWDIVLLDISMPGKSGLEVLREIKQLRPKLPVMVVSTHAEDLYAIRCLKAGAAGYLNKDVAPEELGRAMQKVLRGGRYASPQLAESLLGELGAATESQPAHKRLSNREFEVMLLIAEGKRLTEIAKQMHLSVKTISTHRTRILEKMRLNSNAEITRYVLEHRLTG